MAEADRIIQEVKTVFSAEMGSLRAEMARLAAQAKNVENPLDKIERKLKGIADRVLGITAVSGAAAVFGLGAMAKGLVDISAKTETANLGMALMIQSAERLRGRVVPVGEAIGEAASTMNDLRKAARDTPGTLDQVRDAYQAIMGPGLRSGMSRAEIVKIAAQIATQDALSDTPGLVIRDVSQALRGRNDADSGVLQMSGVVPKAAELARKGKHGDSLRMLAGALKVDDGFLKASGESFEGRMATFNDQVDELKRKAGGPLFKFATEELAKMSAWLDTNQEQVVAMAKTIGETLLGAIKSVIKGLEWMYENRERIILWAKMLVGAAVLVKAVDMMGSMVKAMKAMIGLAPTLATAFTTAFAGLFAVAAILDAIGGVQMDPLHGAKPEPASVDQVSQKRWSRLSQAMDAAENMSGPGAREKVQDSVNAVLSEERERGGDDWQDRAERRLEREIYQPTIARSAADASDRRRSAATATARDITRKRKLPKGAPFSGATNIDARGSRITVNARVTTDDPAQFADVSLKSAFIAQTASVFGATFGLGAPRLADGAP